jgi:hypothetical protein
MKYESVTVSGAIGSVTLSAEVGAVRIGGTYQTGGFRRLPGDAERSLFPKTEYRTNTFRPGQLVEATECAAKLIYGVSGSSGLPECTNSEQWDVRELLQRMGLT